MSFHDWMNGPDGKIVISGAIGSLVGALTQEGNWIKRTRILVVGSLSAYFLSPLMVPLLAHILGALAVDETKAAGLSGFLAGAFSLMIMEVLIQAFRNHLRKGMHP